MPRCAGASPHAVSACESVRAPNCACVRMRAWVCTQHVTSAGNYVWDWTNLAAQRASVAAPLAAEQQRYKALRVSQTCAASREAQNSSVCVLKMSNHTWALMRSWMTQWIKSFISGISSAGSAFAFSRQTAIKTFQRHFGLSSGISSSVYWHSQVHIHTSTYSLLSRTDFKQLSKIILTVVPD